MEYNDRQFSNPHHHHHHPASSLTPDPSIHMQGIPRQHRQLPRPSLLHSSPTPKPLVRVACVLVGRIYKDAVPISSSPAAHPSNPCAITAPSVSSHPTRDGVIVCDLLHDLARSVYNNTHSLIRASSIAFSQTQHSQSCYTV